MSKNCLKEERRGGKKLYDYLWSFFYLSVRVGFDL
jgi:hypothetical protein